MFESAPTPPWVKQTVQVPKEIEVAEITLSQNEVELALIRFVREKYGLPFTEKMDVNSSAIAWKSSDFIVTVTRDV